MTKLVDDRGCAPSVELTLLAGSLIVLCGRRAVNIERWWLANAPIAVCNSPSSTPAALGVIGTLLLHAILMPALFTLRAPSVAAHPSIATGTDGDALLLLRVSPANIEQRTQWLISAEVGAAKARGSIRGSWSAPTLHIDSGEPEAAKLAATQIDRITFIKSCRETYPDERRLNQDLAAVSLQGIHVEMTGGDPQRALIALHCLQALGTLGPSWVPLH